MKKLWRGFCILKTSRIRTFLSGPPGSGESAIFFCGNFPIRNCILRINSGRISRKRNSKKPSRIIGSGNAATAIWPNRSCSDNAMTKERFISSTAMILVTIFAVINQWIFITVLLGLTLAGLYEFFYLVKKKGIPIYSYTGIIIGILIPLSIFTRFEPTGKWELLFIVV